MAAKLKVVDVSVLHVGHGILTFTGQLVIGLSSSLLDESDEDEFSDGDALVAGIAAGTSVASTGTGSSRAMGGTGFKATCDIMNGASCLELVRWLRNNPK